MTGPGTVKRLEAHGIYTMGDLARFSIHGEDRLYEIFGVDAEILIDHAWGYEPAAWSRSKATSQHQQHQRGAGAIHSLPV